MLNLGNNLYNFQIQLAETLQKKLRKEWCVFFPILICKDVFVAAGAADASKLLKVYEFFNLVSRYVCRFEVV